MENPFQNLPDLPLLKKIKTKMQIIQKTPINHDCYIYKFKFVGEPFTLTIGQHLQILQHLKTWQHPQGQEVSHKYTPISSCTQKDTIDILFKIYRANVHPKFPHGGKLTTWLETLNIGDVVNVQGPLGRFDYHPHGVVITDQFKTIAKRLFFIAGGSGITPCYQIIKQIINMKDQTIELILLFANKQQQDIVLRKELEQLQPRLKVHYILDKGNENWKGFTGYVTKQILQQICPLDDPETVYIHCGPRPMNELIFKIFNQNYPDSKKFKY